MILNSRRLDYNSTKHNVYYVVICNVNDVFFEISALQSISLSLAEVIIHPLCSFAYSALQI